MAPRDSAERARVGGGRRMRPPQGAPANRFGKTFCPSPENDLGPKSFWKMAQNVLQNVLAITRVRFLAILTICKTFWQNETISRDRHLLYTLVLLDDAVDPAQPSVGMPGTRLLRCRVRMLGWRHSAACALACVSSRAPTHPPCVYSRGMEPRGGLRSTPPFPYRPC